MVRCLSIVCATVAVLTMPGQIAVASETGDSCGEDHEPCEIAAELHAELAPVIHSERAGAATAYFGGNTSNLTPDVPKRFATTMLWFTFGNDTRPYHFQPAGTLHVSDWRFDIFSPDGKSVLLLQDRFGPYHVVSVDRLRNYLIGRSPPDQVIEVAHQNRRAVHENAQWVSARSFGFTTVCCGEEQRFRADLQNDGVVITEER